MTREEERRAVAVAALEQMERALDRSWHDETPSYPDVLREGARAIEQAVREARAAAIEEAAQEAAGRDCAPYDDVQRGMARLIESDIRALNDAPQGNPDG